MIETDKRQAILHATLNLIAAHGFHGTSVSMIVKASQVSTGIVYHYFQSKDEVIEALYWEIKRTFGQALLVELDLEAAWEGRVEQIWHNAYHFFAAHPKEMRFLEQYENSPYGQRGQPAALDESLTRLESMMLHDIDEGRIKNLPYPALYALTLGVALAVAKAVTAAHMTADTETLATIARACRHSITA